MAHRGLTSFPSGKMLEIISSCTEGLKEAKLVVLNSGLSALANVFAFSRGVSRHYFPAAYFFSQYLTALLTDCASVSVQISS